MYVFPKKPKLVILDECSVTVTTALWCQFGLCTQIKWWCKPAVKLRTSFKLKEKDEQENYTWLNDCADLSKNYDPIENYEAASYYCVYCCCVTI